MKTLAVLSISLATATTLLAQGRVRFANTATTLITTNQIWNGQAQGPMSGVGQYVVGLFAGAAGSSYKSLRPVAYATSSVLPGRFGGGADFTLPAPYDGSAAIAFQVRAWSAAMGADWAEVSGKIQQWDGVGQPVVNYLFPCGKVFFGASTIGTTLPATEIQVSPALFGTALGEISGFAMYDFPCPEPATVALVGVGVAGLLFARRRRQPDHLAVSRGKPVTPQPQPKPTDG
jgi:hypothetical protein